jgi:hypothetical protein
MEALGLSRNLKRIQNCSRTLLFSRQKSTSFSRITDPLKKEINQEPNKKRIDLIFIIRDSAITKIFPIKIHSVMH